MLSNGDALNSSLFDSDIEEEEDDDFDFENEDYIILGEKDGEVYYISRKAL